MTMNLTLRCFWILAACLLLFVAQVHAVVGKRRDRNSREFTGGGVGRGSTREEILGNRERRKRQLQNLINHMRKQLADHSTGEKTLEPKEKADMERRLDLFSRKLNMMSDDLDEKDIERIVARSQAQKRRRDRTVGGILEEESGSAEL